MVSQEKPTQAKSHSEVEKGFLCAFTNHPRLANESYFQHLCFTVGMASRLMFCSIALIIHGLFPFLCEHTASDKLASCNKILDARAQKTCADKKKSCE